MIIYTKNTEIFCMVDESCLKYDKTVEKQQFGNLPK